MGRSRATSAGQSLLGPLDEGQEGSYVHTPSLSKNSSDAENKPVDANMMNTTRSAPARVLQPKVAAASTHSAKAAASTHSTTSSISEIVASILKPSTFNPFAPSDPPPPPPPNPPPSKSKAAKIMAQQPLPPTTTKVKEESQRSAGGIPILSVTTVPGKLKKYDDDTESAFLQSLNTNATPMNGNGNGGSSAIGGDPSQRTSATFGQIPGNVASETIHTSNLRQEAGGASIRARKADRMAAWAIHVALIFFCGLVVASVLISFTVIRNYGFVALVGLMIVVTFVGFLAVFVDQTILSKNDKLKPIRQKIAAAVNATKGLIKEEYHLLVRDWNEHLLLTQGQEQYQAYAEAGDGNTGLPSSSRLPPPSVPQDRKRSKLFKLVKPFLGIKKKLGKGRKKRQAERAQAAVNLGSPDMLGTTGYVTSSTEPVSPQQPDYQPPVVEEKSGVMA
ncbi:MAG: hypothetical protein SGILL_010527 [Bacillariaceae sp.]